MELFLIMCATMTPQEIVDKLVKARKQLGMSQAEVAVQLGITQVQYSKYENCKSDLSLTKFLDLLRILQIDIADFSDSKNKTKEEILAFIAQQEADLKRLKDKL